MLARRSEFSGLRRRPAQKKFWARGPRGGDDQYVGQLDPSRRRWIRVSSFLMVCARPWATSR